MHKVGHYHQRSQSPWFYPTVDLIQDSALFFLDFDIIADIPPVES